MSEKHNVNGNVSNDSEYIDNDNVRKGMEMRKTETVKRADRIADRLVAKLSAPECRPFFCKCAYALSENDIELLLESATKPTIKAPKHYFTRAAKLLIEKRRS